MFKDEYLFYLISHNKHIIKRGSAELSNTICLKRCSDGYLAAFLVCSEILGGSP